MCGRYTLTNPDPRGLRARFDILESVEVADEPRYNIAPTDPVLAVRRREDGERDLGRLRWGLVPGRWAEKASGRPLINARAETLQSQPAFRESFQERRCLIPADGFYEWLVDERGKRPVWLSRPDGELFAFAGIWAALSRKDTDDVLHSCAIVTCQPNELIRPIHDRMPVILDPGSEAEWLDPGRSGRGAPRAARAGAGEALIAREVSDLVNDVREDGPRLLEPREEQGVALLSRRGLRRAPARCPRRRSSPGRGRPPIGRSSSTCHSWLKPIIATTTRISWTGTTIRVSSPSRSSGRAGESRPSLERANQSGAAIAAKIARITASAAATGRIPRDQRMTRKAKRM